MANEATSQAVVAGPSVLIRDQAVAGTVVSSAVKAAPSAVRLASLDGLRGFDMFWIIGADQVIRAVAANTHSRILASLADQFEHVPWAGFHFYDLIFPLFLFMIGASIPFSFGKRLQRGDSKRQLYAHVFTRVAILVFMGMMVNGRILTYDPSQLEATYSVLQVLALGYLVASLIVLNMNLRWQIATTAAMLIVYWALMDFVPVPGHMLGVYKPGANFGDWLNDLILGRFQGIWRFGWILQILTNGCTAMLGVFAGLLLRSAKSARQKLLWLMWLGLGCLAAGLVWSTWFPIIKDRWTSTFVLFAGGWSYLLLALFYFIIDFCGYRKWAFPFTVIGMNAIVAYMTANLFGHAFRLMAEVFVGGLKQYVGGWYPALASLGELFAIWLVLYWLYRNRTFIKV
jgi:predicted acyltransferase